VVRRQIGLAKAIERISQRLGIDADEATDKLTEVCAGGTVRSTGEWVEFGYRRMPLAFRWHSGSPMSPATACNLRNNSIYHPGEGTFLHIEIDAADLEDWLRGQPAVARASSSEAASALQQASDKQIRKAIEAVYDEAGRTGAKPPNIRELPARVQTLLLQDRRRASALHIQRLGSEFGHRRRKRGRTLLSERSRRP
jgi:hypothetical protein